jgi:hypothetical protein
VLRAKAGAALRECGVPLLLQDRQQGLLDDPVEHGRDAQVAGPAPGLRDRRPPDGLGHIGPRQPGGSDRRPVCLPILSQVVHGHPVDPCGALVASDLVERTPEVSRFQHPLQKVRPFHRSVFSPCPSDGFSPRFAQGQLQLPHGCLALARHDATTPLLHAPLGAPFGPSARPRCGSASLWPRLAALGCRTSLACVGPTMPAADCCRPISADRSALSPLSRDNRQLSQGKPQHVPRIDAGCIKPTPLRMEDFAVTCPLVPGVPHLLSGSGASPRACGLGFLQTPPRGGRPGPSPSLRLRDHLARGLSPRSCCAMPGTHGQA